jgi:hypothetical protein
MPKGSIASPSTLTPPTWQQQFIPPLQIAPVKVKIEHIKLVDHKEAITTFEEDGDVDVKPSIDKAQLGEWKGKRKQSFSPDRKDVKPVIPGSRDVPIDIDNIDKVDNEEGAAVIAQLPWHPRTNGQPIIVRNVVYNITYNIINNVVHQSEAPPPPPPPYAPLPGLQILPQPPAAIEEINPDFVPRRSAPTPAALPLPLPPSAVGKPEPKIVLFLPQQRILNMVLSGTLVLAHWSAGTGKIRSDPSYQESFQGTTQSAQPTQS